ncbi:phage portal protein [Methylocystis parvus]|uniref:phage portal protein n=1 Tax=Methylocystis parvus TaxID=134 RepID=UPI003C76F7F7
MGVPAAAGGAFAPLAPRADFTSGSDGRVRQTWGRYLGNGPMGFSPIGWNPWGGMTYPLVGGKPARESLKAAAIVGDLITSNPTLSTIVETIVTHAVGTGLTLSAKPDARALGISDAAARSIADQLERKFADWANDPYSVDKSGRFTLTDYAQLVMRTYVMTGECFVAFDWQGRPRASTKTCLQVLDNLQIALDVTMQMDGERHVFQGIVFNRDGRFLGVMARRMPIGSFVQTSPQPEFIPAYTSWGRSRIEHLFAPVDPRQVRGLSPLVAALSAMLERESLSEFEVVAALLQTQFGISLESQLPAAQAAGALSVSDELSTNDGYLKLKEGWYGENKIRLEPGQVAMLAPGDKLAFHRNEHPNSTFADFDKSLANRAARAAGVEAADVRGDYSDVNFSAARMANEAPYRLNLMRRKAIVERFYQVTFENLVEEWIESGQIALPDGTPPFQENRRAYTAASWFGFGRIQPDPYRQMKTDVEGLQAGVVTLSEVLAERGVDFERHVEALAHEVKVMEGMGLQHPFTVAVDAAEGEPDFDERKFEGEMPIAPAKEPAKRRKVKAFAVEHGTDRRGMSTVEYVPPSRVRPIYEAEDERLSDDEILGL